MLAADVPLAGCALPQSGTRLVCKSACRRSRSRRQQTRGFLRQQSVRAIAEPLVLPFERESEHLAAWHPESWKQLKAQQQPNYQDEKKLREAVETIARMPPLVFAGECRNLQARLANCATGEAFLVQGRTFEQAVYCFVAENVFGFAANNHETTKAMVKYRFPGNCMPSPALPKQVHLLVDGICHCVTCIAYLPTKPSSNKESYTPRRWRLCRELLSVQCQPHQGFLQGAAPDGRGGHVWRRCACSEGGPHGWAVCKAQVSGYRGPRWQGTPVLQASD